jgi:hypothetical protein
MGAALRRVDDELGVFDEVAGVSVLDTATDLLDLVHSDHECERGWDALACDDMK